MKGNCMSLDCKWLVCTPRGGEVWSDVKIIHQYAGVTSVTGCRRHQTDPQNLKKKKQKKQNEFHYSWSTSLSQMFL